MVGLPRGLARARNGGFGEAETSNDAVAAGGEDAVVEREDLGDAERGESAAAARREEFLRSVGGGDAGRGRAVEGGAGVEIAVEIAGDCLLYTSPSPRDQRGSRMPSSA